eukprot:jgi/Psemu1/32894/gm1.32894_g
MADKGGNYVRCWSKYQSGVEFLNPGGEGCSCWICKCQCNVVFTEPTQPAIARRVDPKELEEDTAPKTMPGLVSMIHDSIAEATCAKFLEDTTANKQEDITCNACTSVFFQMASNPHLGSAKDKHKGKTAVALNDTRFHKKRLMTAGSLFQPITIDGETDNSNQQPRTLMGTPSVMAQAKEIKQMPQYVRDVRMEVFHRSCRENTTLETCNVLDLMAEKLTN